MLTRANPSEAEKVAAALHRLTDPGAMGELFKVFCAHSPGVLPVGFTV
jgi:SAM-dependent MidA family methyltransferase